MKRKISLQKRKKAEICCVEISMERRWDDQLRQGEFDYRLCRCIEKERWRHNTEERKKTKEEKSSRNGLKYGYFFHRAPNGNTRPLEKRRGLREVLQATLESLEPP